MKRASRQDVTPQRVRTPAFKPRSIEIGGIEVSLGDPYPGEFARGHVGRWSCLSPLKNSTTFVAALRRKITRTVPEANSMPVARLIALAADAPDADYLSNHTLLPFMGFAREDGVGPGRTWADSQVRFLAMSIASGQRGKFCLDCAKRDEIRCGISYWRRDLQIPGIDWCDEHGGLYVVQSERPFERCPMHWVKCGLAQKIRDPQPRCENDPVKRYLAVAAQMVGSASVRDLKEMQRQLTRRAYELQLRIFSRGNRKTLTQRVQEEFPRKWLVRLFPALDQAEATGPVFNPIDCATRMTVSLPAPSIALAVASMYQNSRDAQDFILGIRVPELPPQQASTTARSRSAIHLRCALRSLETSASPLKELAQRASTTIPVVVGWMRNHRAVILRKYAESNEMRALKAFFEGATLESACAEAKAKPAVVERLLLACTDAAWNNNLKI